MKRAMSYTDYCVLQNDRQLNSLSCAARWNKSTYLSAPKTPPLHIEKEDGQTVAIFFSIFHCLVRHTCPYRVDFSSDLSTNGVRHQ